MQIYISDRLKCDRGNAVLHSRVFTVAQNFALLVFGEALKTET